LRHLLTDLCGIPAAMSLYGTARLHGLSSHFTLNSQKHWEFINLRR